MIVLIDASPANAERETGAFTKNGSTIVDPRLLVTVLKRTVNVTPRNLYNVYLLYKSRLTLLNNSLIVFSPEHNFFFFFFFSYT